MLFEVKNINQIICENRDFFGNNGDKFKNLTLTLSELNESVENLFPKVSKISLIAPEYDFDAETPANGFHSFVDFFTSAIKEIHEICLKLKSSRSNKIFFSADSYKRYKVVPTNKIVFKIII